MELLTLIGTICSILGLLVSLFVAGKVISIESNATVKGHGNVVAGRDLTAKE